VEDGGDGDAVRGRSDDHLGSVVTRLPVPMGIHASGRIVLVNPEIVLAEGKAKGEEGCLSIPEVYGDVERPARVVMRGLDASGEPVEVAAEGLLGRCLQHELDHLDGRVFLDHLSMFKKKSALAAWEREKAKYPALRRTLIPAKDLAEQHNDEAL